MYLYLRRWITRFVPRVTCFTHIGYDGAARRDATVLMWLTVVTGKFWASRAYTSLYMQHIAVRAGANRRGNVRSVFKLRRIKCWWKILEPPRVESVGCVSSHFYQSYFSTKSQVAFEMVTNISQEALVAPRILTENTTSQRYFRPRVGLFNDAVSNWLLLQLFNKSIPN